MKALELARTAEGEGEVPVGAVVVREGVLLGEGCNRSIGLSDPTAHAEILALRRAAAAAANYRLPGSTLYVTLEPCLMCVGAVVQARVGRLVYGAPDTRWRAGNAAVDVLAGGVLNHRCEVTAGVLEDQCMEILNAFFRSRRGNKKEG